MVFPLPMPMEKKKEKEEEMEMEKEKEEKKKEKEKEKEMGIDRAGGCTDLCLSFYLPIIKGTSFNNSFICAGEGKEGACVGDSGGGEEQRNTIARLQPIVNVNNNHT